MKELITEARGLAAKLASAATELPADSASLSQLCQAHLDVRRAIEALRAAEAICRAKEAA